MALSVAAAIALLPLGAQADGAHADPPSPKREVPDYDGRSHEPTTAGDVALWVPRVVLSPIYFTTEYLIRRPLAAIIPLAERADVPRKVYDFLTFGPEHKAGIAPVAFVEFAVNPSVGVYAFWDDAGFPGHDLRLHAEGWPTEWLGGSLTERFRFDDNVLELRGWGVRRPDHQFFGLGPTSLQADRSRYGEDYGNGRAKLDFHLWRASRIQAGLGIRGADTYDGHYGSDPSLTQEAATGAFPIPYGFGITYSAEYNFLAAVLDTRRPWPAPGSGVRLEAQAEQATVLNQAPLSGWLRYGASAVGFYDLNGRGRVLSLSVTALFADPTGRGAPIPFTELVTLGGDGPMRGYYEGRLVGRSAAVATARYVFPLAAWIHANFQAAVGNVFGTHLDQFAPGLLRFAAAVGVSGSGSQDYPLEVIVGFGSETFDHGGQINTARVAFGVTRTF
jgi:hypothetical protein